MIRGTRLTVVIGVCSLLGAASVRAQDPQRGDVRAAMAGFTRALNALDVDSMSRYFSPDITAFVPVAQAERVEGKAALVAIFQAFVTLTRPVTARLNIVQEDEEVVGDDSLAVVTFNVRDRAAGLVRRRTVVWERREGRWFMRHMHASDLAPVGGKD